MSTGGIGIARDKLEKLGAEALRDEELLAILLRTEAERAEGILKQSSLQVLIGMQLSELIAVKGIGRINGAGLIAAFELARRALNQGLGIEPPITKPADAVGMLTEYKDRRREHFVAIFLNARNQVINREEIAVGSLTASLVHPREVFYSAIGSCAASVILAHNHPSGNEQVVTCGWFRRLFMLKGWSSCVFRGVIPVPDVFGAGHFGRQRPNWTHGCLWSRQFLTCHIDVGQGK